MSDKGESAATIAPRKRRPSDADIDITPMIDIVFLLLAFFVIVSKMDSATPIKMPNSKFGISQRDATLVVILVKESKTETPLVYLGKTSGPGQELRGSTEEISDQIKTYVENELRSNAEKTGVLIKAERTAKSRDVAMVKLAAGSVIDEGAGQAVHVGIDEK
ncbi:MAG TPA: biopolymer transporter ExbD [Pirellulaceae bacterium]|mgnify:CR=1 FL=1|nr:biopolymer transporter ExbD [Pirellulaceae bacterium]HMO90832.1 biopolymer transporter ExbD [Pirellulaceae bacterium]HMP68083.1 biopolymer transporter ExbD [Pirellulaceae bacterium]